jgi:ATP-binding cassette subfamily C protein CydCD
VALFAVTRLVPIAALAAFDAGLGAPVLATLAVLAWAARTGQTVRARAVGLAVRRRAAEHAACAIARRAPARVRGGAHDAVLARVWRGIFARGELATDLEPAIVGSALATPFALVAAWFLGGPSVVVFAAAALVLVFVVRAPLARRQRARIAPYEASVQRLAKDLGTGMRALDDLHAHGLARVFAERVSDEAAEVQRTESELETAMQLATWTPLAVAGIAALAWLGPRLAARDGLVLRQAAIVFALAPLALAVARGVSGRIRARADSAALTELVRTPDDLPAPISGARPSSLLPLALVDVTYAPPSTATPSPASAPESGPSPRSAPGSREEDARAPEVVLDHVSLRWGGARPLALVGPNGSGKSTVLSLLLRLADPTWGDVRAAGLDLRSLDARAFRTRIAYVPQRPLVLEGMNVREAMRLVAPDVSDDALLSALDQVGLRQRLVARGAPLDVLVAALSVGEAQRVAIARALARDPLLLVLDEPEAALDEGGRAQLRATLEAADARGVHIVIAAQHTDVLPPGTTILQLPLSRGAVVEAP